MAELTLVEAIDLALARAMAEDERVLVLGEDVGRNGGVFRATQGLLDRFGPDRVRDTPLAESAIAGLSVGLAAAGMRPVAEIQFDGFALVTIDQMANHAARLRTRTRGRLTCPMVMRIPYGGGIHAPEHHSECVEAFFAHIPGLRVVIPSSPRKAYGLLLAAIRDPDPVIFLEPKRLYRALQEDVRDDGRAVPLDHSFTLREGRDVTIVAWGSTVPDVLAAADGLRAGNIHADVIDLATLSPLDPTTILHSVEKTGRCVIVEEASLTAGFGAEIAARIAEHALLSLLAPVRRVAAFDCVVPLAKLEAHYLPSVSRITAATKDVMGYR
jgi:pyruvate dehydrogenase E1 component beta subunit